LHTQQIGVDDPGALPPRQTAAILVRNLADCGFGAVGSRIPIDFYLTHQRVVGLLADYESYLDGWADCLEPYSESGCPQPPPVAVETVASAQQLGALEPSEIKVKEPTAEGARKLVNWCQTEAGGMRALFRNEDAPPDLYRALVGGLIEQLRREGFFKLAASINPMSPTYSNPPQVIKLFEDIRQSLEEMANAPQLVERRTKQPAANPIAPARGPDTIPDSPPKISKKRSMTAPAADCARRFKKAKKIDPSTRMQQIVDEYVSEKGGSVSYILRVLNDNPGQWRETNSDQT
jgi:hypothetical protein